MDLLAYFRVLRRRWWVIALCVLLGVGLGWASTVLHTSDGGARAARSQSTYHKATHIFVTKSTSGNSYPTSFNNLDQMALLATTGPVPDAVAKQLGGSESGQQLAEQITTLTNGTTGTLSIVAVDPGAGRAAELADAFADQLVADLSATDNALYQQASKDAQDQVNSIQGKMDDLTAQIGAKPPPPNIDVLQAQLKGLQDQYSQVYGSSQALASQTPPVSPLSTLQKAQSVPIGADEYNTRLRAGQLGQNNLQAGGQAAVQPAVAASSSSSLDSNTARVLFGGFLGLLTGIGLAILLERLDRRIRTHGDAEAAFNLPVLADVPVLSTRARRDHDVVAVAKPLSAIAEAYRAVRSSLLFQQALAAEANGGALSPRSGEVSEQLSEGADAPLVVMVTSAEPQDGKSTSSANLAAVFAEAGSSVLVVNCDFRRPMIHEFLGVPDEPRRVHHSSIPGVRVVTNVTAEPDPNPAQVIALQRQLIATARKQFDVLILDTAPLLSANDALEMVGEVDFVVLVARAGWSKIPAVQRAIEMLDRVDAPVVGAVLVGAAGVENTYYAYYHDRTRTVRHQGETNEASERANSNGHSGPESLVLSDPTPSRQDAD